VGRKQAATRAARLTSVTKSGTNDLHGTVYYYNRNEYYAAHTPFLPVGTKAPPLRNENYGASGGGPIRKTNCFSLQIMKSRTYHRPFGRCYGTFGGGGSGMPATFWRRMGVPVSLPRATRLAISRAFFLLAKSPTGCANTARGFWPTSGAGSIKDLPATLRNFFSPIAEFGYSYNGVGRIDYQLTINTIFMFACTGDKAVRLRLWEAAPL